MERLHDSRFDQWLRLYGHADRTTGEGFKSLAESYRRKLELQREEMQDEINRLVIDLTESEKRSLF